MKIEVEDETTKIVRAEIGRYRRAVSGKEDSELLTSHVKKSRAACDVKVTELQRKYGFTD
jgi:hypothetical protein